MNNIPKWRYKYFFFRNLRLRSKQKVRAPLNENAWLLVLSALWSVFLNFLMVMGWGLLLLVYFPLNVIRNIIKKIKPLISS